jgi:hemerythrin
VHHFGAEETLMRQHAYTGMAEHVAEHQAFVAELRTFRETFRRSGASTSLVVGVNKRLCGWLVDHVGRMDRQLGGFLSRAA